MDKKQYKIPKEFESLIGVYEKDYNNKRYIQKLLQKESLLTLQYIYKEQERFTNMESFKIWLKQEIDKIKLIQNEK